MHQIALDDMLAHFPYSDPRVLQKQALQLIADSQKGVLLEIPTGEGKTGIGLAVLRAMADKGQGPFFYVTPTKTQVDQVMAVAGNGVQKVLGRTEYSCLYYEDRDVPGVSAEASPCHSLKCGHRLDPETGQPEVEGLVPCPYLQAKWQAMQESTNGGIIVCTTAFFLTNRLMVPAWRDVEPACVVVDEAHRLAKTARGVFEYTVTDYHLKRAAELLVQLDRKSAKKVKDFRAAFMRVARKRSAQTPSLLKEEEIESLVGRLDDFDSDALLKKLRDAVEAGKIDPLAQKEELKLLENLSRNIPRLVRSLRYAMEGDGRRPLNYVVAFYYKKDDPEFQGTKKKARYFLTIKSYFVVPVIKKALGQQLTVAYSATIGDPSIIKFEAGINLPFQSFSSGFSVGHTRIFVPSDCQNLATKTRRRQDLNHTLRRIAETAKQFSKAGHRSLVVVVSEAERQQFLRYTEEAGLEVVSYSGNGMTARQAAAAFVAGQGQALVGTAAQYGEGVDLPRGIAPIIFFLRPGYQRPTDPEVQFEERRFSEGQCWALWNWRVMIEALQVRGRNIRTARDLGVCFFMSQQFRRFLYPALPEWLKPAYNAGLTMEQAVGETMKLLK